MLQVEVRFLSLPPGFPFFFWFGFLSKELSEEGGRLELLEF